jgi:hypothetical protein
LAGQEREMKFRERKKGKYNQRKNKEKKAKRRIIAE